MRGHEFLGQCNLLAACAFLLLAHVSVQYLSCLFLPSVQVYASLYTYICIYIYIISEDILTSHVCLNIHI